MAALALVAGFAALSTPALAAGAFSVTTDFPTGAGGPYATDLAGIGVTVELASPAQVTVFQPTNLTFRLLESHASRQGTQITTLVVDGVDYNFGTQAFTAPGALLGSQLFSGAFSDLVGFRDASMPADAPPIPWPEAFQVYILGVDEPNFTGIGPFIGSVDTLYFDIAGLALFEVTASPGGVPEPATWALMIGGFAVAGARLRRVRRVARA